MHLSSTTIAEPTVFLSLQEFQKQAMPNSYLRISNKLKQAYNSSSLTGDEEFGVAFHKQSGTFTLFAKTKNRTLPL